MEKRSGKRSGRSFKGERGMSAFLLFLKERRVERAPFFDEEREKERAPEIRRATNALIC